MINDKNAQELRKRFKKIIKNTKYLHQKIPFPKFDLG